MSNEICKCHPQMCIYLDSHSTFIFLKDFQYWNSIKYVSSEQRNVTFEYIHDKKTCTYSVYYLLESRNRMIHKVIGWNVKLH